MTYLPVCALAFVALSTLVSAGPLKRQGTDLVSLSQTFPWGGSVQSEEPSPVKLYLTYAFPLYSNTHY
jgi:hypothetical protein